MAQPDSPRQGFIVIRLTGTQHKEKIPVNASVDLPDGHIQASVMRVCVTASSQPHKQVDVIFARGGVLRWTKTIVWE
jgi:hypothetical protein